MSKSLYLIALGGNQRHPQLGMPRAVLRCVAALMDGTLGQVLALSPIIDSAPIGPSQRVYANAALVLETELSPQELLICLQEIESQLGRVRRGQRWRSRVIDLDIILWSGGFVADSSLSIPHPLFRERAFVTGPAAAIAPDWRDPLSGLSLKHLHARLTRKKAAPIGAPQLISKHRNLWALSSVGRATDF